MIQFAYSSAQNKWAESSCGSNSITRS